jgi:hypothetical protein
MPALKRRAMRTFFMVVFAAVFVYLLMVVKQGDSATADVVMMGAGR